MASNEPSTNSTPYRSALAEGLPLYTTDPDDFKGLEELVTVRAVTLPRVPHESSVE